MKNLPLVVAAWLCQFAGSLEAAVTLAEQVERDKFVAARMGLQATTPSTGQLKILKHFDIVWQNCRVDRPLTLGSREYRDGLFTHAPSDILVQLPGPAREFTALVGVDTNSQTRGGQGSVVFSVTCEGTKEVFRSGLVREGNPGLPVRADLAGAMNFSLQVSDGGDGVSCDQAVWVNPQVTLEDGRVLRVSELPISNAPWATDCSSDLPFSFTYGDRPFAELVSGWEKNTSTQSLDSREDSTRDRISRSRHRAGGAVRSRSSTRTFRPSSGHCTSRTRAVSTHR